MPKKIRTSVIAGSWYPGDPDELRRIIEGYYASVKDILTDGDVLGLISPHAGFAYSGQVAAYGYKQVMGKSFDVVIIISPQHQMGSGRYVINSANYYSTPLGEVAVDKALIDKLKDDVDFTFIRSDQEHSLEIQLPFLQVALENFSLLPIMVGFGDLYDCEDLVAALIKHIRGMNVLLVASSDLHHIPNYDEVKRRDKEVVEALTGFDLNMIREVLSQSDCSVCGRVPMSIVIDVAQRMGADKLHVLNHTNSGDVSGDKRPGQYTVGYLSAAIVKKT